MQYAHIPTPHEPQNTTLISVKPAYFTAVRSSSWPLLKEKLHRLEIPTLV